MSKDEKKKIDNYQVVQSNPLIEAQYKLDLLPQKLIRYLVSLIKPNDDHFEKYYYRLNTSDFARLIDTGSKGIYKDIKKAAERLKTSSVIYKKAKTTLHANWLASYEYHDGEGWIEFEFSSKLEAELLNIKGKFTKYELLTIAKLKSQYAIRIYELLLQYRNYGQREVGLDELKANLGIGKDEYKLFGKFKQSVLDVSHREINEKTDISYTWRPKKNVRKVVSIVFENIKLRIHIPPWLIGLLPKKHRTNVNVLSNIREWLPKRGEDYIREKIEYTSSRNPDNYPDYLYKALEGDYGKDYKATPSDLFPSKAGYPTPPDGTIFQSEDGTTVIIEGGMVKRSDGMLPISWLRKEIDAGKYHVVDDVPVLSAETDAEDEDVFDIIPEPEEIPPRPEANEAGVLLRDGVQVRVGERIETVKNGSAGVYSQKELVRMISNNQAELILDKSELFQEGPSAPRKAEVEAEHDAQRKPSIEFAASQVKPKQEGQSLEEPIDVDEGNTYSYFTTLASPTKAKPRRKKEKDGQRQIPKTAPVQAEPKGEKKLEEEADASLLRELLEAFKEGRIVIKPPKEQDKGNASDNNRPTEWF